MDKMLNHKLMQSWYASDVIQGKGNIEIMQYTGLKDINDKEIYEGDILKHPDYKPDTFSWEEVMEPESGYRAFGWAFYFNPREAEVIGNIYEYPEILEANQA